MATRGTMGIICAVATFALFISVANQALAWEQEYRYPIKVRVSENDSDNAGMAGSQTAGIGAAARRTPPEWDVAAGQAKRQILCPKRGFALALGMRPYFTNLLGNTRVVSKSNEGTSLNLTGHLRIPSEKTQWEFYSYLRLWDRATLRLEYLPWSWSGSGHAGTDGNFAGLLIKKDDPITTDLSITSILIGGDFDVAFGRDLTFGPNGDLYVIKWSERVGKDLGESVDFNQTIVQPAIGAHLKYEPTNTGYFSWFKPFMEGRFNWMSFGSLGMSSWDLGAGVTPPVSRNVDAGFKIGYKQWRMDGNRNRLFTDLGVEGVYLDFSLQF
jgi:hypothetical protein